MTKRRGIAKDPIARLVGARLVAMEGAELLTGVIESLPAQEATMISMRFGLDSNDPMTLGELGEKYGVTRERIRQIEERTLWKLRHPSRSGHLREYDETGATIGFVNVAGQRRSTARDRRIFEAWRSNIISCAHCGQPDFASRSDFGGRPRKYCSNKCRQAAYRARRSRASSP